MATILTNDCRLAIHPFWTRKRLVAETRLFLVGLTVYTVAFVFTTTRGSSLQAPEATAVRQSPVLVPSVTPSVTATPAPETSWDRNIHALPSRGKFKRFYRMTATAYRPIHRGIEGGRWTATQRDGRSSHGVAVDPDLIPLGSRLWIPGYGHAIADDTGGWIKGHRIDIRCQTDDAMDEWGRRKLRVYVLEEPEEMTD